MKLNYYADTNSHYIDLTERHITESREITEGVVLDYDAELNLVGIDIDNAAKRLTSRSSPSTSCRRSYRQTRPKHSAGSDKPPQ
jgi:uncharacterized protein YuzE